MKTRFSLRPSAITELERDEKVLTHSTAAPVAVCPQGNETTCTLSPSRAQHPLAYRALVYVGSQCLQCMARHRKSLKCALLMSMACHLRSLKCALLMSNEFKTLKFYEK